MSLKLRILAYVRKSEALVQIAVGGDASGRKGTGRAGFALWRSRVYLSAPSRSSTRATQPRILVAVDRATARASVRPRPESLGSRFHPSLAFPLLTLSASL